MFEWSRSDLKRRLELSVVVRNQAPCRNAKTLFRCYRKVNVISKVYQILALRVKMK